MIEMVGCLHIHTTCSDGSATPERVAELAGEAGLDFIGINDHMTLAAGSGGCRGWRSGTFVLAGAEINDSRSGLNHLLAYGIDDLPPESLLGDPEAYTAWVRDRGGKAIAAHPRERGSRLPVQLDSTRALPWTVEPRPGMFDGVEVWNYMSQWKSGLGPGSLLRSLRRPDSLVTCPSADDIGFWRACRCAATGGPDAHCFRFGPGRWKWLEVFPYETLFGRIRSHVFLEAGSRSGSERELERDLLEALFPSRLPEASPLPFISNALAGRDARGFRMRLSGAGGDEPAALELSLPEPAHCRLDTPSGTLDLGLLAAGTHRVETGIGTPEGCALQLWKGDHLWVWCGIF